MPKPHASTGMDRLVASYDPSEDAAVCAAICETLYDERFLVPRPGRAPASTAAIAGEMRASLWRSVLASFVEGFGAYGMALCYLPPQAMPTAGDPSRAEFRNSESTSAAPSPSFGNVIQIAVQSGAAADRPWHRRALAFMVSAIAGCAAHWRRERDIRRAVAALEQLDDHMLRDMGIPSRTEIEHVVRFCHDC